MIKAKQFIVAAPLAVLLLVVGVWVHAPRVVLAADNNIASVITVDSTGDLADDDISDGICADSGGECTLRAAIEEANDTAGTQTIEFNITGTADFNLTDRNSVVKNGYTIHLQTSLPEIDHTVIINGYSQPGSLTNTAVAPAPLNGTLLIEVSAGDIPSSMVGLVFGTGSDNSEIKGLVLNEFTEVGSQVNAIIAIAQDVVIQGNYIGTNPAGTAAISNEVGLNHGPNPGDGDNVQLGGLNPADRNLISGNDTGDAATAGYPGDGWVIQGNFVGVGANGTTVIANSTSGGSGSFSVDNADNVVIGGSQTGAINVISGSLGHGIAPHNADNVLIEGNYIGLAYDGTTILGNGNVGSGITISESENGTIKNNRIAGSTTQGIDINRSNNTVVTGNLVYGNGSIATRKASGISINEGNNNRIGGSTLADRNIVYGNGDVANVGIQGFNATAEDNVIQGNYIGVLPVGVGPFVGLTNTSGVTISYRAIHNVIGGVLPGEANVIGDNNGSGVQVTSAVIAGVGSFHPSGNSILGNSIYNTSAGAMIGQALPGLGIDHFVVQYNGSFAVTGLDEEGVTPNDSGDGDTGPNAYINFPVLATAKQTGTNLVINYKLDAAGSPSNTYRVEFFANDTADTSGYGEGKTYLGAVTAENGTGNSATLTLASGTNLSGKVLSATTTVIDTTTVSDFGATSEFSAVLGVQVVSAAEQNNLADTGFQITPIMTLVAALFLCSNFVIRRRAHIRYIIGKR